MLGAPRVSFPHTSPSLPAPLPCLRAVFRNAHDQAPRAPLLSQASRVIRPEGETPLRVPLHSALARARWGLARSARALGEPSPLLFLPPFLPSFSRPFSLLFLTVSFQPLLAASQPHLADCSRRERSWGLRVRGSRDTRGGRLESDLSLSCRAWRAAGTTKRARPRARTHAAGRSDAARGLLTTPWRSATGTPEAPSGARRAPPARDAQPRQEPREPRLVAAPDTARAALSRTGLHCN